MFGRGRDERWRKGGREGWNAAAGAATGVVVVVHCGGGGAGCGAVSGPAGGVIDEAVQGEEVVKGQEEGQAG